MRPRFPSGNSRGNPWSWTQGIVPQLLANVIRNFSITRENWRS
jgi:hypothetical protein